MADRTETSIIVLVLLAAGGVLAAPVVGRLGAPTLADVVMGLSAACGVGAFALAGVATFRGAARPDPRRGPGRSDR
jgi:hypothetical protein